LVRGWVQGVNWRRGGTSIVYDDAVELVAWDQSRRGFTFMHQRLLPYVKIFTLKDPFIDILYGTGTYCIDTAYIFLICRYKKNT
jgi:hypothetical protein